MQFNTLKRSIKKYQILGIVASGGSEHCALYKNHTLLVKELNQNVRIIVKTLIFFSFGKIGKDPYWSINCRIILFVFLIYEKNVSMFRHIWKDDK